MFFLIWQFFYFRCFIINIIIIEKPENLIKYLSGNGPNFK